MMLTEVTPVPQSALPVALFKDHLRLGSGFADDALQDGLLETYLRAAMATVEARTGKILIEREFQLILPRWRDETAHALPVAPVNAMTEVVLVDADAADHVIAPSVWRLVPDAHRPFLAPRGGYLPAPPVGWSIRLGFLAGFGPEFSDLPPALSQAVLLLAAHYYDHRGELGQGAGGLPVGVAAMIEPYRTLRLGVARG